MPHHTPDDDPEFEALTAAPRQARFPPRRKVVRQQSGLPRLTKSQSTLTQVGWAGLSSSGSRAMGSDSDSDDGFAEPQPKRRRRSRKLEKTESQPTYTQAVHSAPARRARRPRLDGDRFEIWQDAEEAVGTPLSGNHRVRAAAKLELHDRSDVGGSDEGTKAATAISVEIPESELFEVTNSMHDSRGQNDGISSKPLATPQKVHFKEIPSSQSPASVRLSTQRSSRGFKALRSPLKEKSSNARSPTKLTAKVASPVLSKDASLTPTKEHHPTPTKAFTTNPQVVRTFKRINTVPETQYDDLELSLVVDEAEVDTQVLPAPEQRERRTFQRTNTIQDSQHEDSDLDLDLPDPMQRVEDNFADEDVNYDNEAGTYSELQLEDNTYDPVCSALDRDAARFADQDQTQTMEFEPHVSNSTHSEDEEVLEVKAEPLHTGGDEPESSASERLSNELMQAAEAIPSSQPSERKTARTSDQSVTQNVEGGTNAPDHEEDDERVPSSPPPQQLCDLLDHSELRHPSSPSPLRPSQVSTVVPTQMSPRRPVSREGGESLLHSIKREKDSQTQALLLGCSPRIRTTPQKTLRSWSGTCASSSPLPLPPWSSPDRARCAISGLEGLGREMGRESLADFSLPPPPPLSSSSGREE